MNKKPASFWDYRMLILKHEICFKTIFPYFGLMILTCYCLLNIWPFFPSRSSKELWIISLKDHHKHVSLLDISWSILLHLSNWKPLRYLQITRSAHIAYHMTWVIKHFSVKTKQRFWANWTWSSVVTWCQNATHTVSVVYKLTFTAPRHTQLNHLTSSSVGKK